MATTYLPNDTNCGGWDTGGAGVSSRPAADLSKISTSLNSSDLDEISQSDSEYVDDYPPAFSSWYGAIQVKFTITENVGNISNLAYSAIGYGYNGPNEFYYYIWNDTNSEYELVDSDSSGSRTTLSGSKSSSISDYVNDSGEIYFSVYSGVNAIPPGFVYLDYMDLDVTTGGAPAGPLKGAVILVG